MSKSLEQRVVRAAESALAEHKFVAPVDVLVGIGWLHPTHVDGWRRMRLAHLEEMVPVDAQRISTAMTLLRHWAEERGLVATETDYVGRTRDRRPLQFSASGDPETERAYRTHWMSPDLSGAKRQQLIEKQSTPPDLVVIEAVNAWTCARCGDDERRLLIMDDEGPLCMPCAELDHLVYLPRGDAALTRRAKKASGLSAVVVRWSRARKRYERQGLLVEEEALSQAEKALGRPAQD